jgi:hypothetical protein
VELDQGSTDHLSTATSADPNACKRATTLLLHESEHEHADCTLDCPQCLILQLYKFAIDIEHFLQRPV